MIKKPQKGKPKKVNRRNFNKYPGLNPNFNLKTRVDLIDFDYIDKLSDKEKAWLNNFVEEYNSADFRHKGKKLHSTKKAKRDCYNRNNARNRDIFTKSKASGKLDYYQDINKHLKDSIDTDEDYYITLIDIKDSN